MAVTSENRDAHCKFYTRPSTKYEIQNYANDKGFTFSEACEDLIKKQLESIDALRFPLTSK